MYRRSGYSPYGQQYGGISSSVSGIQQKQRNGSSFISGSTVALIFYTTAALLLSITAVVGVGLTTHYWMESSDQLSSDLKQLNPDNTLQFNTSLIGPNTVVQYIFPNDTGTIVLTSNNQTFSNKIIDGTNTIDKNALPDDVVFETGAQPIADKALDNTNSITIKDQSMTIEKSSGGGSFQFNASILTLPRTYSVPDTDMSLVGSNIGIASTWNYRSLGMAINYPSNASSIRLRGDSVIGINRFFQFSSDDKSAGYGGILMTGVIDLPFIAPNEITYAWVVAENALRLTMREEVGIVLPEIPMVDRTIMSFGQDKMTLHKITDSAHSSTLDPSQLTDSRNHILPDQSGTFALTSQIPPAPTTFGFMAGRVNFAVPHESWTTVTGLGPVLAGDYGAVSSASVTGVYSVAVNCEWDPTAVTPVRAIRIVNLSIIGNPYAYQSVGNGDTGNYMSASSVVRIDAGNDVVVQVYQFSTDSAPKNMPLITFSMELLREL